MGDAKHLYFVQVNYYMGDYIRWKFLSYSEGLVNKQNTADCGI